MKTDHVCPNYSLNIVFTTFLPQLYLRDWHRLHMSLLVSYYLPQGCNDKQKLFLSIPQPAFIPLLLLLFITYIVHMFLLPPKNDLSNNVAEEGENFE